MWGRDYIVGIYLNNWFDYKYKKREIDFRDISARDPDLISITNKYVHTEIYPEGETIGKMMENGQYVKYQCWPKLLLQLFSESDRSRYRDITYKSLIQELGRTELTVGNGFKLYELDGFFERNRIPVRVYNAYNNLIFFT
jgi:hypothetical protein